MKNMGVLASSLVLFSLTGCATSEKVQVSQISDRSLSCQKIKGEFDKLDKAQADIEGKKGVTETNVAAAVAWIPGLVYTYYDAGQATDKINERRSHLTDMFNAKQCDPAIMAKSDAPTSEQK